MHASLLLSDASSLFPAFPSFSCNKFTMADAHIAQGNTHFRARNYDAAAESFTCALEQLSVLPAPLSASSLTLRLPPSLTHPWSLLDCSAAVLGDFSPESADVLLLYGKTLLEIGIKSNEVMKGGAGAGGEPSGGADGDEGDDDEDAYANGADQEAQSSTSLFLSRAFCWVPGEALGGLGARPST